MRLQRRRASSLLCRAWPWLVSVATADVYMINPRGSNNKLAEVSNNADNQNRLFDSQNNAAGGFQVGDNCLPHCKTGNGAGNYDGSRPGAQTGVMYYYHGSELTIEWTAQHGCGYPGTNTACQIVIQYMCASDAPDLRDGRDKDASSRRRTAGGDQTNPQGADAEAARELERGRHESFASYDSCRKRSRNKGLYTAGRNLNKNIGATATRQNNGGTRRGLECPEERDYYPYWHPTEWRDAAVLTSNPKHCDYYREESQNVKERWYCQRNFNDAPAATLDEGDQIGITQKTCEDAGDIWIQKPAWDIPPPECLGIHESRDNHHGNTAAGGMANYIWRIPDTIPDGDTCVLRIRYNISTADFNKAGGEDKSEFDPFFDLDAAFNGNPPLKDNPRDDFVGIGFQRSGPLQVQVDTAQFGRTFQDRSHTFVVRKRPDSVSSFTRIVNMNVRGRRGNIVQVYPSVEYDFVPTDLTIEVGDLIHFQWTGSDANPNGNAGNGKAGTDRSNLVQIPGRGSNKPLPIEEHTLFFQASSTDYGSEDWQEGARLVERFAFLDQQANAKELGLTCPATQLELAALYQAGLDDNDDKNCQQLNLARAYFDGGLVEMKVRGEHHIASTRNNDYSNRSQKATIRVIDRSLKWYEALAVAAGVLALLGGSLLVGNAVYALMNPTSPAFSSSRRPCLLRTPCCAPCLRRKLLVREEYKKALREADAVAVPVAGHSVGKPSAGMGVPAAAAGTVGAAAAAGAKGPVGAGARGGGCCWNALRCCGLASARDGDADNRGFFLYLALNLVVALVGLLRNWNGGFNKWYAMAKCGGYILDFNLSVLLLPTMRTVQKYAIQVRALDSLFNSDPIGFHIMVAGFVGVGTLIHCIGHILHIITITRAARFQTPINDLEELSGLHAWELLFHPNLRAAPFTGILLVQFMAAMAITASPRVRRHLFDCSALPKTFADFRAVFMVWLAFLLLFPWGLFWLLWRVVIGALRCGQCCRREGGKVGGFKIFWAVHKLWMPCYLLLFIHGPNCFIWFLWPLIFLVLDRLVSRERRDASLSLKVAEVLKGPVLKLTFGVPHGFVYQAGQYIQLCCDQVNGEEWHPFTLTSAPEESTISVHIRCPSDLDWCSALRRRLVDDPVNNSGGKAAGGFMHRVLYEPYTHVQDSPNGQGTDVTYSRPTTIEALNPDRTVAERKTVTMSMQWEPQRKRSLTTKVMDEDGKRTDGSKSPKKRSEPAENFEEGAPDAEEKLQERVSLRGHSLVPLGEDGKRTDCSKSPKKRSKPPENLEEGAPDKDKKLQEKVSSRGNSNASLEDRLPPDVIRMRFDGPHGAPSELVWKNRVVMLVGAGIGVTPFASILRSLQYQVKARYAKKEGESEWMACERVYFFWLCRGQDEFLWFYDLLRDAITGPARKRIEVNLFQTGEVQLSNVKVLDEGIQQFMGKPNWRRAMKGVAEKNAGETVGVFLCGPQAIRGELEKAGKEVSSADASGVRFIVHSENF